MRSEQVKVQGRLITDSFGGVYSSLSTFPSCMLHLLFPYHLTWDTFWHLLLFANVSTISISLGSFQVNVVYRPGNLYFTFAEITIIPLEI